MHNFNEHNTQCKNLLFLFLGYQGMMSCHSFPFFLLFSYCIKRPKLLIKRGLSVWFLPCFELYHHFLSEFVRHPVGLPVWNNSFARLSCVASPGLKFAGPWGLYCLLLELNMTGQQLIHRDQKDEFLLRIAIVFVCL